MNLQYIQSELFRELVGMETLLNPWFATVINKYLNGSMSLMIVYRSSWNVAYWKQIDIETIKTGDDITKTINRIWDEIPTECKKSLT